MQKTLGMNNSAYKSVSQVGSCESGEVVFTLPFFSPPQSCEGGEKRRRRKQQAQILAIMLHKFLVGSLFLDRFLGCAWNERWQTGFGAKRGGDGTGFAKVLVEFVFRVVFHLKQAGNMV